MTAVHEPIPVEQITVDAPKWQGLQRQVLRMHMNFRAIQHQASEILAGCRHADKCEAWPEFTRPCLSSCPDRERALSAVVIFKACTQFTIGVTIPSKLSGYTIPQREYFDAIVAELEMRRAGQDVLERVAKDWLKFQALVPELGDQEPDYSNEPTTRLMPPTEEAEEEQEIPE